MNIVTKVGFNFLFNIVLYKYGIVADNLEIPKDIVEQIQNILEIFENWMKIYENQITENNDKFIAHFKDFGKRIARILSLPSNNNIWWLWELSILSNSVDKLYQPFENLEIYVKLRRMTSNAFRISEAISLIKDQMKNYLKKDKKNKGLLGLLSCTKTVDKKQPIESIDDIDSKLNSLDEAIQGEFGEIEEDKAHFYTPQNLFFFDIILNKESIRTIFTKCEAIEWKKYDELLIKRYHEAMHVWIDQDKKYIKLITYRETLLEAIRISFCVHIKLLISIYFGYESKNNKQNIQYWDDLWNSITSLVKRFIDFFHLNDDEYFNKIHFFFSNPHYCENKGNKIDLFNLADGRSSFNNKLYNGTFWWAVKYQNDHINMEGLELLVKKSFKQLETYLTNIEKLFEKYNFKISKIFYNIIPNKTYIKLFH